MFDVHLFYTKVLQTCGCSVTKRQVLRSFSYTTLLAPEMSVHLSTTLFLSRVVSLGDYDQPIKLIHWEKIENFRFLILPREVRLPYRTSLRHFYKSHQDRPRSTQNVETTNGGSEENKDIVGGGEGKDSPGRGPIEPNKKVVDKEETLTSPWVVPSRPPLWLFCGSPSFQYPQPPLQSVVTPTCFTVSWHTNLHQFYTKVKWCHFPSFFFSNMSLLNRILT